MRKIYALLLAMGWLLLACAAGGSDCETLGFGQAIVMGVVACAMVLLAMIKLDLLVFDLEMEKSKGIIGLKE